MIDYASFRRLNFIQMREKEKSKYTECVVKEKALFKKEEEKEYIYIINSTFTKYGKLWTI